MPKAPTLIANYLPKIFNREMEKIINSIANCKLSFILDESQDICGRPTVLTLVTFFDEELGKKPLY